MAQDEIEGTGAASGGQGANAPATDASIGSGRVEITPNQRMALLITAIAGHGIKHLLNAAFFVLLPEMKAGLGLNNTQIGTLSTFRFIAGGVANFPAGYIADRYTHLRAIVLGLSIAGIGITGFLVGISTNFWLVTLFASIMVISISMWHPAAIGSLSRQFADRRGFAISLHGTGGSVGEAVGPLASGLLLAVFSWQVIFQGSIVPSIILGFIIWLILRRIPAEISNAMTFRDYTKGVGQLLRSKRLLLVLLFAGGFAGGQSVILTFLPIYLREDLDASPQTVGFYLSILQVAGIASQPLMGYFSDRWGRKIVLVPTLVVLGIANYSLSIVPDGLLLITTLLIMGLFVYSLMAIFLAAATDLVPGDVQATTVSLVFGVATAVAGLAPIAAGVLADSYTIETAFVFGAGLVLTTAVLAAVTKWERPRISAVLR